jgi:hypothetical protein
MKKIIITSIAFFIAGSVMFIDGCATSQVVASKTGVQLWGENCQRCHNTPSPTDFSDAQWETIGMHMKVRANIGDDEIHKIIEFLQSAN